MDIKEAWKRTSEILQEAQSKNMWCEIDSILAAHIREQTTLRAERDALAAKVRELEEELDTLQTHSRAAFNELASAKVKADALQHQWEALIGPNGEVSHAIAIIEELRKKAETLDRLEEMLKNDPKNCGMAAVCLFRSIDGEFSIGLSAEA